MQLKNWLDKEGRSASWLAIKLKVTDYRARRIVNGMGIGATEIASVSEITDGAVNINDWVKLEKARAKNAK